jgi:homoserine dehydrogenase
MRHHHRRSPIKPLREFGYYLRLRVEDKPGVLADITRILADQQISIDAMIQREPEEGEAQTDIIMLTHVVREKQVDAAIAKIEALPVVNGKIIRLRLENLS